MGFWKMKGLRTVWGFGHVRAANLGTAFTCIEYVDVWAGPVAASVSAATSVYITPLALSDTLVTAGAIIAQPDFPRNLTVWCTVANTCNVTITGTDQFDASATDTIACNGAAIVAGTTIFKTITAVSAATRTGSASTLTIGCGSKLGTSRRIIGIETDGMVFATANGVATGVQETTRPVKATTAGVYGVTFSTALDPANTYVLLYHSDEAR